MFDTNTIRHGLPPNRIVAVAMELAEALHRGQERKFLAPGETEPEPYIMHPIRVARAAWNTGHIDHYNVAAALLHDTIEDCGIDDVELHARLRLGDLSEGAAEAITKSVVYLTDQAPTEAYGFKFNRERRKAWEAGRFLYAPHYIKTIKLCDFEDNTRDIVASDPGFAEMYLKEKAMQLPCLRGGDRVVFARVEQQLNNSILELEKMGYSIGI